MKSRHRTTEIYTLKLSSYRILVINNAHVQHPNITIIQILMKYFYTNPRNPHTKISFKKKLKNHVGCACAYDAKFNSNSYQVASRSLISMAYL